MPWPKQEEFVLYQGGKFQVEFYFTERGKMPAKEYFDSSERHVKVKLLALVKYIAEEGRLFDKTKFRLVDNEEKIYEFKPLSERFFSFFYEGKKIIVTNAYRKKGQKVDSRELARAIHFKKDYESRLKGGDYYEAE
jgi:hypothetical protein